MDASDALRILKGISNEDCKILGFTPKFTRPENMIFEILPVLPIPSRPTVEFDATFKSEDDLTHQYMSILKMNLEIKKLKKSLVLDSII